MPEPPWKILLSPPEVGDDERDLLMAAFDSGWVAPAGPDIDAFEDELATLTGTAAVAAMSSGTASLHLALLTVGVSEGDDVLVSTLTFGASALAVTYLGLRPCFVDCEPGTWQLDPTLLEDELERRAADNTLPAAVISVDLYGSMAGGPRIVELCRRFEVPLIEATPPTVIETLREAGIEARHGFEPMHLQPVFSDHPVVGGGVAAQLFERAISLPSGSRLSDDDVGSVMCCCRRERDAYGGGRLPQTAPLGRWPSSS